MHQHSKTYYYVLSAKITLFYHLPALVQLRICRNQQSVNHQLRQNTIWRSQQNWSISEDEHGILYFGNDIGLLEFDGIEWKLNKLPKAEVVRSVYAVSNNEVYTGGYEEFGKWSRQPDGELTYTSLSKELPARTVGRMMTYGESCRKGNPSIFNHSAVSSATIC